MTRIPVQRSFLVPLAVMLAMLVTGPADSSPAAPPDALDDLAAMLDPSADAVLLTPQLKHASEQFTQLMQGMDRAQLMLGSRPLDQLQSFVDITTGVDEFGGAAALLFMGDEDEPIDTPEQLMARTVFVVPVRDHTAFREANFDPDPAGSDGLLHSSGFVFHVRDVGHYAVMGVNAERVMAYQPAGMAEQWLRTLGDEGHTRLRAGEVLCIGNRRATDRLVTLIADTLPDELGEIYRPWTLAMLDAHEPPGDRGRFAAVFDFDPLALIVREMITMDTHGMEPGAAPALVGGLLGGLPDRPHHAVGAVDLRRPATRAMLDFVSRYTRSGAPPPDWLRAVDTAQVVFARKPGSAADAFKGGLLSDSTIVLRSSEPRAVRFQLLRWLESLGETEPGATVSIDENKTLSTGEVVDVVSVDWQPPANEPMHGPLKAMLIGAFGWRGHVLLRDDAVLITLGRSAASRARAESQLSNNAMVQAMLAWLPQTPAGLVFLPVAENMTLAEQVMSQLPFVEPVDLPEPAGFVPPIALAIDLADRTGGGAGGGAIDVVGITTIVPAQALTLVADAVLEAIRRSEQQQADDGDDA